MSELDSTPSNTVATSIDTWKIASSKRMAVSEKPSLHVDASKWYPNTVEYTVELHRKILEVWRTVCLLCGGPTVFLIEHAATLTRRPVLLREKSSKERFIFTTCNYGTN